MTKKNLKFTINQLIINGKAFDASDFSAMEDEDLETHTITQEESKEVLSIKKIKKSIIENRFITIYFNEGDKFPYSKIVIDSNDPGFGEKNNPRPPEQIELDNQFFVLIDIQTQRIYMSDHRKKGAFIAWLSTKIKGNVVIKSIIQEDQFIEKIKSINEIFFTVTPSLLNSSKEDILSNNLVKDIYGFGAERAKIEMKYKDAPMTNQIIQKLKSLISRKNDFESIVVIGRTDENIESIFNLNEIVSKISVDIELNEESKQLDHEIVFNLLIINIKSHGKNTQQ